MINFQNNIIMAWLGYNVVCGECIFKYKPVRGPFGWEPATCYGGETEFIELPEGTIQKLIGKRLTEDDDTVDLGD